jgi:hypothetical protein
MPRIVLGCALLILLAACAPTAPSPTAAPPGMATTAAAAAPTATPAPPPTLAPSPHPTQGVPGTRAPPSPSPTPRPSPSPAVQKPSPSPPETASTPVPTRSSPAPTASGRPGPGTATAAAGPRATPLRVGGAPAQQIATAPGAAFAAGPGGLYRLEGDQASLVRAGPPPPNLLALDGDRLVGGQAPGCMRDTPGAPLSYSRDGGKSWQEASVPTVRGLGASPRLARGEEVFALDCAGVLWSQDGGKSYAAAPTLSRQNYDPWDLAIAPDGGVAYLAGVSEGGTLEVTRATRVPSGRGKVWGAATRIDEGWGNAALGVASDGRVFLGTVRGVKASADRGATWQSLRAGLEDVTLSGDPAQGTLGPGDEQKLRVGAGITDIAFLGPTPLAATRQGIYRLSGGRWERWSDVASRVDRLEVDGGTVYALTPSGVVALRG